MWPFRQSLGLDHVDRYNTWAVLFLLLLALISWLLPLSPVLLSQAETPVSRDTAGFKREPVITKMAKRYKAQCWCPAQFTGSHVSYTHAVCEAAFNFIINGGNYSEAPASLYGPAKSGEVVPVRFGENMASIKQEETDVLDENVSENKEQQLNLNNEGDKRNKERVEKALYFFQVSTPFNVFLLAVCLAIPRFVWHALSCLLGGINVDQTLVSANQASNLNPESRQQLHSELSRAAIDIAKSSPCRTSFLYLLLKVLMCVAVISETVVVHNSFLPETKDLVDDFQQNDMRISNSAKNMKSISDNKLDEGSQNTTNDNDLLLFCGYKIRVVSQVQVYEMQCLFSPVEVLTPTQPSLAPTVTTKLGSNADGPTKIPSVSRMYLYECLYLIIFTMLVALAANNVVSFLVWLVKLTCRPFCGGSDLPLDIHFLLQMAKENARMEFASVFSQREKNPKQDKQTLAEEDIELKA